MQTSSINLLMFEIPEVSLTYRADGGTGGARGSRTVPRLHGSLSVQSAVIHIKYCNIIISSKFS